MYKKIANILKLIISVYFVFLGVQLVQIMMEQRPGDLTFKLMIAAAYILAGAGYFLWTLNRMSGNIWGKAKESWQKHRQETKKRVQSVQRHAPERVRPQRDSAMFRTAPMTADSEIIKGTARLKDDEPEDLPEGEENKLPKSWDEATRAMWLEEEDEVDSLKRYWNQGDMAFDDTEELPGLSGRTQELPVIPEDTQEILASVGGETRVIPDISDMKEKVSLTEKERTDISSGDQSVNAAENAADFAGEEPREEAADYEEV